MLASRWSQATRWVVPSQERQIEGAPCAVQAGAGELRECSVHAPTTQPKRTCRPPRQRRHEPCEVAQATSSISKQQADLLVPLLLYVPAHSRVLQSTGRCSLGTARMALLRPRQLLMVALASCTAHAAPYFACSSSTSKMRSEFGGMSAPAPCEPYASLEGMNRRREPPTRMP